MKRKLTKISVLILALVLFTGTFSAAAATGIQPRYTQVGRAEGRILYSEQKFTVKITGVSSVTQITGTAVLYEEGFWGDTKIATLVISASGTVYNGEQVCTIQQGKSYRLEITASGYRNGVWEPINSTVTANF